MWYEILREYLQIILNWPFLGAVLLFWFVFYYKKEIRTILNRMRLNKIGVAEFGQVEVEEVKSEIQITPTQSIGSSPNWEFMYYGKVIAEITAQSLLWLNNIGSSTKLHLFQNMVMLPSIPDIAVEKEAQFSAMLNYKFIEQDGEVYRVSQKGKEFLRYYRFIA